MRKTRLISILMIAALFPLMLPIAGSGVAPAGTSASAEKPASPDNSGLLDIAFTSDGIWWPDNYYARYRGDEYPQDETYYQWWFWAAKDLSADVYFTVTYYYLRAPGSPTEGAYVLFTALLPSGKIMIWYKYDLSEFAYLGNYFGVSIGPNVQMPVSNEEYNIYGTFNDPSKVWAYYITVPGVDLSTAISWNLHFTRIVGCLTQNDLIDNPLMEQGIKWDTHSFDSLVAGTVNIGGTVYTFQGASDERGYMDMNFDKVFLGVPGPDEPEDKYRWSWASATKYDGSNPNNDISIIAGYGISDNLFGLDVPTTGIFAAAYNVLGHNIVWKSIDTRDAGVDVNLVEECSWGTSSDLYIEVTVEAWDYFYYTDDFGTARIPRYQRYTLEGEYVKIVMTFTVNPDEISRLPTPYSDYIWSNFEALGCTAFVQIYSKSYAWWDVFHLFPSVNLVDQFYDYDAGLEYGYAASITL